LCNIYSTDSAYVQYKVKGEKEEVKKENKNNKELAQMKNNLSWR